MRRILDLSVFILILTVASAVAADIKLTTGDSWQPFTDEQAAGGGLATEVVVRIFEEIGDTATVDHLPWARSYELTRRNQYAGTFPWYQSVERAQDMHYSDPLLTIRNTVFARGDRTTIPKSWDATTEGLLCRPTGFTILPQIQKKLDSGDIKMIQPPKMANCFRMLEAGRVDYVITSSKVGWFIIHSQGLDLAKFKEFEKPIEESTVHLLVPKNLDNANTFIARFNIALNQLKEDGAFQDLIDNNE